MSLVKANTYQDASGGSNAVFSGVASPPNSMGFRNRIINGNMVIDQRNAGASVTPASGQYLVDRFKAEHTAASKFSGQRVTTAPAGFNNSLLLTSLSAYSVGSSDVFQVGQVVEGFNIADFGWGTADAKAATLSFWVRSSLTGTFGGVVIAGGGGYNLPVSYTISSANTWEYKTVSIPAPTTGSFGTSNDSGAILLWSLGCGTSLLGTPGSWTASTIRGVTGQVNLVATNGATFYITGVQLEAGTNASAFEQIDYGRELMMCQRYCVLLDNDQCHVGAGVWYATTAAIYQMRLPVQMRAAPTLTNVSPTVAMYINGAALTGTAPTINTVNNSSVEFYTPVSSGSTTAGYGTSARYTAGKSLLTSEL
jgi:hypothetical protein